MFLDIECTTRSSEIFIHILHRNLGRNIHRIRSLIRNSDGHRIRSIFRTCFIKFFVIKETFVLHPNRCSSLATRISRFIDIENVGQCLIQSTRNACGTRQSTRQRISQLITSIRIEDCKRAKSYSRCRILVDAIYFFYIFYYRCFVHVCQIHRHLHRKRLLAVCSAHVECPYFLCLVVQ